MEIFDIVDLEDNVIGNSPREEVYKNKLTHRIAHVIVFNSAGKLVIQKRSTKKSYLPGYWVTAGSGHLISGENYYQGALRELTEEAGAEASEAFRKQVTFNAEPDYKFFFKSVDQPGLTKFVAVYKIVFDGAFTADNPEEVEEFRAFTREEIENDPEINQKLHPELKVILKNYLGYKF